MHTHVKTRDTLTCMAHDVLAGLGIMLGVLAYALVHVCVYTYTRVRAPRRTQAHTSYAPAPAHAREAGAQPNCNVMRAKEKW